jgi:uncharacterized protein (TIGR04255 family)
VATRKYRSAPLVEAICEFQFAPTSQWDLAIPGLIFESLRREFPERRSTPLFDARLGAPDGALPTVAERVQFWREDHSALTQVAQNLLVVNHLRPYPGWEGFRPLIQRAFESYNDIAHPSGLKELSLRYINVIELEGNKVRLEDFLDFYPHLGTQLPQTHSSFLVGVGIPDKAMLNVLRLELASRPSRASSICSLTLDLTCVPTNEGVPALSDVAKWLEDSHAWINECFEGAIKQPLRERFGEI